MKRRVRHLAESAGLDAHAALEILRRHGLSVRSINDLLPLARAEAAANLLTLDSSRKRHALSGLGTDRIVDVAHETTLPGPARDRVHAADLQITEPAAAGTSIADVAQVRPEVIRPERTDKSVPASAGFLSEGEVLEVHFALVKMFADAGDPIVPNGPRDLHLLGSALLRPQTAIGQHEKYPSVPDKAAALLHSLVQNHPFHNGNKRTALIATLMFLDKNGRRLAGDIEDDDIFNLVTRVAARTFP